MLSFARILKEARESILAGILAWWILAGILEWILAWIFEWILAGILPWIFEWILAGILAWILERFRARVLFNILPGLIFLFSHQPQSTLVIVVGDVTNSLHLAGVVCTGVLRWKNPLKLSTTLPANRTRDVRTMTEIRKDSLYNAIACCCFPPLSLALCTSKVW